MSLVEVVKPEASPRLDSRATAALDSYEGTFAHALALAPTIRSERAALAAIPPVERRPALPDIVGYTVTFLTVAATAGGARVLAPSSPLHMGLAAGFGLAAAASGGRLGRAIRAWQRPAKRRRAVLALAVVARGVEIAVVIVAAALLAASLLAGFGLVLAATAAAIIAHRSRMHDVEMEARAAVREQARIRLEAAEQAAGQALDAVRAAHAADLTRLARAMDGSHHDGDSVGRVDTDQIERDGSETLRIEDDLDLAA